MLIGHFGHGVIFLVRFIELKICYTQIVERIRLQNKSSKKNYKWREYMKSQVENRLKLGYNQTGDRRSKWIQIIIYI